MLARQFEIHGDLSLDFNRFAIEQVRLILPLFHGACGGLRQLWISAENFYFSDVSILGERSHQLHRAFNSHAQCVGRIRGLHLLDQQSAETPCEMLSLCKVGVGALLVAMRFGKVAPPPAAAMLLMLGGASLFALAFPVLVLITIGAVSFAAAFLLGAAGVFDVTSSSPRFACAFGLLALADLSLEPFGRPLNSDVSEL